MAVVWCCVLCGCLVFVLFRVRTPSLPPAPALHQAWLDEREPYLAKKEDVKSSSQAQAALQALSSYDRDSKAAKAQAVPFKKLGAHLNASKYESKHSQWVFPDSAAVNAREAELDSKWAAADAAYANKLAVLQDDLERETYREGIVLQGEQHVATATALKAWLDEKEPYLSKKEDVKTSRDAQSQLQVLSAYAGDAKLQKNQVPPFKALGASLLAAKYESKHSQWAFPDSAALQEREKQLDDKWTAIDAAYNNKLAVLSDDLKRESYREGVVLQAQQHVASHTNLKVSTNHTHTTVC